MRRLLAPPVYTMAELGELRIGFTSSAPFIKAVSDTPSMFRQRLPDVHILTRETNTRGTDSAP